MGNKCQFLFWRVISCYLLLVIRLQEEVFDIGTQDCWSWKGPLETTAQRVFCSSLFRAESQWDLNIPKDRDLQHGQSVGYLTTHTINLIFINLHGIFCILICALCLFFCHSTTEKGPSLSYLLPHQVFLYTGKTPLIHLLFPAEALSPSLHFHQFEFSHQDWRSLH